MVIGVTGTNGSGKGTVVDYLVSAKGFKKYWVRAFLKEELKRRGLEDIRPNLRKMANELRATHEPAYIIKMLHEQSKADGADLVVIDSVRNSGEAAYLKSQGAYIIATDADPKIRYERIIARAEGTDKVDFETFLIEEEREKHGLEGKADTDFSNVMEMADVTIKNEGSLEDLHAKIDEFLKRVQ